MSLFKSSENILKKRSERTGRASPFKILNVSLALVYILQVSRVQGWQICFGQQLCVGAVVVIIHKPECSFLDCFNFICICFGTELP